MKVSGWCCINIGMKRFLFPLLLSLLVLGSATPSQAEGTYMPDDDIQLTIGTAEYLSVNIDAFAPVYGLQFLHPVSYAGRTGAVVVAPRAGLSYSQLARARLKRF